MILKLLKDLRILVCRHVYFFENFTEIGILNKRGEKKLEYLTHLAHL